MNPHGPSIFDIMILVLPIFGIYFFLIIRPQQKQEKKRKAMLSTLSKGDKVLTAGGLIGTVSEVMGEEFKLEIAQNVKVKMTRSSIVSLLNEPEVTKKPSA
jgi:preprotein translocase subunit YajC